MDKELALSTALHSKTPSDEHLMLTPISNEQNGMDDESFDESKDASENVSGSIAASGLMQAGKQDEVKKPKSKFRLFTSFVARLFAATVIVSLRFLSIIDLVTDINLLVKSVESATLLPFSISLFLSIIAPYILSYSSGMFVCCLL